MAGVVCVFFIANKQVVGLKNKNKIIQQICRLDLAVQKSMIWADCGNAQNNEII
jgi:hypothetical protein